MAKDTWCRRYVRGGVVLYGGPAREARIADCGGMDNIINEIRSEATENTLRAARKWFERIGIPAE